MKPLPTTLSFCLSLGVALNATSAEVGKTVLKNARGGTATIEFTLPPHRPLNSGSFDGKPFSDYLWVFFKFSTNNGADGAWKHATLAEGGTVKPVADRLGAFIAAADAGGKGKTFSAVWNFQKDGVRRIDSRTVVKVFAVEMVRIPQGSFFYNCNIKVAVKSPDDETSRLEEKNIGGGHYNNFGDGKEVLVKSPDDIPKGAEAGWQNGFNAFYIGKYEVSHGQYANFLNHLPAAEAAKLYSTGTFGWRGYRLAYDPQAPEGKKFTTDAPDRAYNLISWNDAKAYLSWCGLRPMTEMEFEKAARGTDANGTNKRQFPWGDTMPDEETALIDGGTHTAHFCNWGVAEGGGKPVPSGWYLAKYADEKNGASPYGVADLAGNLWEQVVLCTWQQPLANGNGSIIPPDSWPPPETGKGWRGGGWGYVASDMRISARGSPAWAKPRWHEAVRRVNIGIRGARSE
jgi:formylglycine-generating enzyme required for sulfatase activity